MPILGRAEEFGTIYFGGYTRHFKPSEFTHEGNMQYVGYSKEFNHDKLNFDTGVSTFIDSYGKRAFVVFSDISNSDYRFGYFQPILALACTRKGKGYDTDATQSSCFPLLKVRVGSENGLFVKITPIPPIGNVTFGSISFEFGYKW